MKQVKFTYNIYIYTRFSHFSVPKKSQIEQWTSKKGVKNITKPYIYIYTHNLDIFIKKNAARHTGKKNTKPYIYIYIYIRETLILWPKFKSIFFVFFPRLNRENVKNDT